MKVVGKGKYNDKLILVGRKIAYYRKLRGYTQLELSEKANLSKNYLSLVERPGKATALSLETLFLLADILEVPASKFLEMEKEK